MRELKTEYLFDAHFTVGNSSGLMPAGDGGWGTRVIAPVTGGTIEGPKIKGTARPFGADWFVIRHDGVFIVDVRLVIETDDGAFIHTYYDGIVDVTEEDLERMAQGMAKGELAPLRVPVHTTPRFETGHEKYRWLNRLVGIGIGEVNTEGDPFTVDYSIYALR
jgi:hypothetical protein